MPSNFRVRAETRASPHPSSVLASTSRLLLETLARERSKLHLPGPIMPGFYNISLPEMGQSRAMKRTVETAEEMDIGGCALIAR